MCLYRIRIVERMLQSLNFSVDFDRKLDQVDTFDRSKLKFSVFFNIFWKNKNWIHWEKYLKHVLRFWNKLTSIIWSTYIGRVYTIEHCIFNWHPLYYWFYWVMCWSKQKIVSCINNIVLIVNYLQTLKFGEEYSIGVTGDFLRYNGALYIRIYCAFM